MPQNKTIKSISAKRENLHFIKPHVSKNTHANPKGQDLVDTNMYQSKINLKLIKYQNKEFELMGVTYYKASYSFQNLTTNFSVAIIPKNSVHAKDYLTEIERQNGIKLDIFIKPILYYYDENF